MSSHDPGLDTSFDALRRVHRLERAPDALRRRVLERARSKRSALTPFDPRKRAWLLRPGVLGLAASVAAGVWFGMSRLDGGGPSAAPSPPAHVHVVPSREPVGAPETPARRCPTPLPELLWNPKSATSGETFEMQTNGCGTLARRYLVHVPANAAKSAPVWIVLHHGGQNADVAPVQTLGWFDDLLQRERGVLVYANGSQSLLPSDLSDLNEGIWQYAVDGRMGTFSEYVGVWQTDEGAHPAVDDSEYLRGLLNDLRTKQTLAQGDVFLAGYGSGGVMALGAALRHPERYAGVAAFLPTRVLRSTDLDSSVQPGLGDSRLKSVFIVLREEKATDASLVIRQWAAALGIEPSALRVTPRRRGIQRFDATLAGGAALRILQLSRQVDPFPLPGAGGPLVRKASEARPFFFDGPQAAWAFFHRTPR